MATQMMSATLPAKAKTMGSVSAVPDDIDFAAIMRLMTSKHTIDLTDRHVSALRKVCKQCKNGFLLKHLEPLIELIRLVVQRFFEGLFEFGPAICEVTRVASQPFVSCKASDMITYGQHLPMFITSLVHVLSAALPPADDTANGIPEENRSTNERIRIEVAHMLACWSRFGLDEESIELRPDQPLIQAVSDIGTPNLRILQQSQAIDELSAAFRVEDSPEAIVIMLGAIRDMSLYRPLSRQITNCGLLSNLIHVIRVNLLGSDVLLVAAEILWNVLELDWEGAAEALGNTDIVESFRDFMDAVLTRGYRFKDKIFRNDMMVLLMYISKRPENRPLFASTGLVSLLLKHGISESYRRLIERNGVLDELMQTSNSTSGMGPAATVVTGEDKKSCVALTNSQEDMEFRILLWSTIARCCSDESCATLAGRFCFVPSLLSYLDVTEVAMDQRQWSKEQRKKMQLEALSALFLLVQYMPEYFMEGSGNDIVLRLLQNTVDRDLQKKCLHLLQVAVKTGKSFVDELGTLGCVSALIELFKDKDATMVCRQLCASVLAGLCSGHAANCREFRKKGGVEAVRQEVVYRPDETTENHLFYTLCVVDCVWCSIVGTRKNEHRFLDVGGLFALLDVLEVAPMLLKRQIIGCIADLVENRKAAKLFVQWNSQTTMKGALKILLELWSHEQVSAVNVNTDGVIRDLDRPLNPPKENALGDSATMGNSKAMGKLRQAISHAEVVSKSKSDTGSKLGRGQNASQFGMMVVDQQDARAKIYSILSRVGFEGHDTLNIEERQQMELLKLYPDCRQLETWSDVKENLLAKGIKPISADLKWIEESINERRTQTAWIQTIQQQLADERHSEEQASLHRFYDDIRNRGALRKNMQKDANTRPTSISPGSQGEDGDLMPGDMGQDGGATAAPGAPKFSGAAGGDRGSGDGDDSP
jgi:hypothetical protein